MDVITRAVAEHHIAGREILGRRTFGLVNNIRVGNEGGGAAVAGREYLAAIEAGGAGRMIRLAVR